MFLLGYAALAARRAVRTDGTGLVPQPNGPSTNGQAPVWPIALTALAMTWLNPSVYLDTAFLIGSVAATHGSERWLFALGAGIGSVLWFVGLGFGARYLSRLLRTPRSWRFLDGAIALLLVVTAVRLALV